MSPEEFTLRILISLLAIESALWTLVGAVAVFNFTYLVSRLYEAKQRNRGVWR